MEATYLWMTDEWVLSVSVLDEGNKGNESPPVTTAFFPSSLPAGLYFVHRRGCHRGERLQVDVELLVSFPAFVWQCWVGETQVGTALGRETWLVDWLVGWMKCN